MLIVIDIGSSNLHAMLHAIQKCGVDVEVTDDPDTVAEENALVLPWTGPLDAGLAALQDGGMADAIREAVNDNHATLLAPGTAMMLAADTLPGNQSGLGLLPGEVIPLTGSGTRSRPMIGWCPLEPVRKDPILRSIPAGAYTFFRARAALDVTDAEDRLADVRLGAARLPALVRHGNVIGTLFELERSGEIGLRLLMNFLRRTSSFSSTRLRADPRLRRQTEADLAEEADATRTIE